MKKMVLPKNDSRQIGECLCPWMIHDTSPTFWDVDSWHRNFQRYHHCEFDEFFRTVTKSPMKVDWLLLKNGCWKMTCLSNIVPFWSHIENGTKGCFPTLFQTSLLKQGGVFRNHGILRMDLVLLVEMAAESGEFLGIVIWTTKLGWVSMHVCIDIPEPKWPLFLKVGTP